MTLHTRESARARWLGACWAIGVAGTAIAALAISGQESKTPLVVEGMAMPASIHHPPARVKGPTQRTLTEPAPNVVPEAKANPAAVPDKYHARFESAQARARLRAYEGAPPVVPHATEGLSVHACRECHGQGLRAGDKVARMASHTYLANCTQCHVEDQGLTQIGVAPTPVENLFKGLATSGYGSTRAWVGAPPVIPHTTFMRTNCISCHGEYGYDGWRPDHLSRTNCVQCHTPGAHFEQMSPVFGDEASTAP